MPAAFAERVRKSLWLLAAAAGAWALLSSAASAEFADASSAAAHGLEVPEVGKRPHDAPTAANLAWAQDRATFLLKREAEPSASRNDRFKAGSWPCGPDGLHARVASSDRAGRPLCVLFCIWVV